MSVFFRALVRAVEVRLVDLLADLTFEPALGKSVEVWHKDKQRPAALENAETFSNKSCTFSAPKMLKHVMQYQYVTEIIREWKACTITGDVWSLVNP